MMPRLKQRTPELRDRVLLTAVALLAREGVGGFTARRIAAAADTSPPAIYELFGDKSGLVQEVFFTGFRLLGERLRMVGDSGDQLADMRATMLAYREFMRENAQLAEVMFARPFADFDPAPPELEASAGVRRVIVERVERCVRAGLLRGDPTDIAHVTVALVQGLAFAESARRLGSSVESIERRWGVAFEALLAGLS